MIISDAYKFIFIAITKTGTSYIEKYFTDLGIEPSGQYKHTRLRDITISPSSNIDEYFKFCFVRNPWDRVLSSYFQSKKPHDLSLPHRKYLYELSTMGTFSDYCTSLFASANPYYSENTQVDMIKDTDGVVNMDFIGRFERLQKDLFIVCSRLGLHKLAKPPLNTSPHRHYSRYYTTETKVFVADYFRDDVNRFGYSFEELNWMGILKDELVFTVKWMFVIVRRISSFFKKIFKYLSSPKEGEKMKKMLITGGSKGIGKACAEYFKDKYQVITVSRHGNTTEKGDLTDIEFLQNLMRKYPDIDVLINNAGGGRDNFYKTNLINYIVPGLLMEFYTSNMKKGHIINITSNSAYGAEAYPKGFEEIDRNRIWYCASKNAAKALSNALSRKCANVKISSIEPSKIGDDIDVGEIPKTIDWIMNRPFQVNTINITK